MDREQGIGKAGNRRVRTVMVELAWLWTRYQPGAAPGPLVSRAGRINRTACAEDSGGDPGPKLLIALWRFVIDGVVPEGAILKPAA